MIEYLFKNTYKTNFHQKKVLSYINGSNIR